MLLAPTSVGASKSGAVMKDKTPVLVIANLIASAPPVIVYVIEELASTSAATTVVT